MSTPIDIPWKIFILTSPISISMNLHTKQKVSLKVINVGVVVILTKRVRVIAIMVRKIITVVLLFLI